MLFLILLQLHTIDFPLNQKFTAFAAIFKDIDITKSNNFKNYLQIDPRYAHTLVGSSDRVDTMYECGCFISSLATVITYYTQHFDVQSFALGQPHFPVPINKGGITELSLNFYPNYIHDYLVSLGEFGYKKRDNIFCDTLVQQHALANVAQPLFHPFFKSVTGVTLDYIPGFNRNTIDRNLEQNKPTLVITRGDGEMSHTWIIVGFDSLKRQYLVVDPLVQPVPSSYFPGADDFFGKRTYQHWESLIYATVDVKPVSTAPSFIILSDDPAPFELLAFNPDGHKTGYDRETKEIVREDKSISYGPLIGGGWSGPFLANYSKPEEKSLTIENPSTGTYRFEILGTSTGIVNLTLSEITSLHKKNLQQIERNIIQDQIFKYELNFQSGNNQNEVSEVSTFTPEARAGNDVNGVMDIGISNAEVNFDASRSFDIDGDITSFSWDFGDGTTGSGEQVSHSYAQPGIYTVKLTVTDNEGSTDSDNVIASISQLRLPVANPSGPYVGWVNSSELEALMDFNGFKSYDPNNGRITKYIWDFGDSSPLLETRDPFAMHGYVLPGKYNVTLIVNNGRDNSLPATTTVEILPSPTNSTTHPFYSNRSFAIGFDSTCANPGDNVTISGVDFGGRIGWDYSEGPFPFHWFGPKIDRYQAVGQPFIINPTYPDFSFKDSVKIPVDIEPGEYFIGGAETHFPGPLTIPCPQPDNFPPNADAGGPYISNVNIPVSFDGSDSTDPEDDQLTYFWNFGDNLNGTGISPQHTYNNPGEYIAKLTVSDGNASSTMPAGFAKVTITNNSIPANNPPLAISQQVESNQDNPLQITLSGSDPLDGDAISQFKIINDPTNGQISNFNQLTGELTYIPTNNFIGIDSFTFKVIDSRGLESTESAVVSINVKELPPPVNNPPITLDKIVETNSNTPVSITLEGTDIDQEDSVNSFTIISSPTNGQIFDFNSNIGTLTYISNNNFVGQDSFTFKVTDSRGLESTSTGLVTINVKSTQEPPNNEQPPLPLPSSFCTDFSNTVKPKGTQGNDELVGTSQRDAITGLGGNDRFNGCSGDDTLNGNLGNDGIAGGFGDDDLRGNEGNDYLQGDSGNDYLFGNEGNDILVGKEGEDRFFCGSGHDKILDFDNRLDKKSNHCEEF